MKNAWLIGVAVPILIAGFGIALILGCSSDSADAAVPCHKLAHKMGRRLTRRVTLGSTGSTSPINMSETRGIGETDIVVGASPSLPHSVSPQQLTLTVPKRFERSGTNLTSDYLPDPTFSKPKIREHGKIVTFTLCVNVTGAQAGTYIGQVVVGGPKGIQPATVPVTVNVKNQELFLGGMLAAGGIAFLLLLAQATRKRWPEEKKLKVAAKALADPWGFWLPTVIAIAAAVIAMYQVWDNTVGWGADTGASLIALGGTTLSAAGINGFLTSIGSSD